MMQIPDQIKMQINNLLYKYEAYLAEKSGYALPNDVWERIWKDSAAKSIEHVFPQDINSEDWKGKFGSNEEAKVLCHRLGNLILIPPEVNSKLGNQSFLDKKIIYGECSYLRMIREIAEQDEWNIRTLNDRELKILEWAESYWKINAH